MEYIVELPYPPTVNHYYGYKAIGRGIVKTYIKKKGKDYQTAVADIIAASGIPTITGGIALRMQMYTPDRVQRDIDNVCKALYDSCTKGGLWSDDSFIVYSQTHKYYDEDKVGKVVLHIKQVDNDHVNITKSGAWLKGEK